MNTLNTPLALARSLFYFMKANAMFNPRCGHVLNNILNNKNTINHRSIPALLKRVVSSSNIHHANITSSAFQNCERPKVCWLDLNGSGLSAIERLCLEEALLRHDPLHRSWAIIGTHDPIYNTRLKKIETYLQNAETVPVQGDQVQDYYYSNGTRMINQNCIIIMGIGGKPENLLNIPKVKKDGVVVIKRFSGGGTVVVDHSSLWTTFIGRTNDFPNVPPYPKNIMKWSADEIFHHVFQGMGKNNNSNDSMSNSLNMNGNTTNHIKRKTLIMDTKSCGLASVQNKQRDFFIPDPSNRTESTLSNLKFELRENDYVLGEHKMGGNAQSITNGAWLHHTSFLWDYSATNMEYLSLPQKRPDYRGDRQHDDFLIKLKSVYGDIHGDREGKQIFFSCVKSASEKAFELQEVNLSEALHVVDEIGGFQQWFDGKCRTKVSKI